MTHRALLIAVACHAALPATGEPPEHVHLIPAGEFRGVDGRGPYRLQDAAAVIAASELPAPIDEAHVTDLGAPIGAAAPARGWITELEARADGIWGRVEWTGAGRALVADRAYRGISPVFDVRKADGTVLKLRRASLTNVPNLPQLTTLHAQQGVTMDLMTRLRALLGLDEAADEAAVITAMEAVMGDRTMQGQALGAVRKALGVADAAAGPAILAALQARIGQAGAVGELQQQVTVLQQSLEAEQTARATERATAAVDAAIRAGKPIKALRDRYISRHAQDPAGVDQELAALPSLHEGGIPAGTQAPDADGLTQADRSVIALMGLDAKEFRAVKATQGVAVEGI